MGQGLRRCVALKPRESNVSRDTLTLLPFRDFGVTDRHLRPRPGTVDLPAAERGNMFVALTEILRDQLFQSAQPLALAGAEQVATTRVRWVHPSEVVQVGGLLHGDELLLTTGAALLGLRIEAQHAYLQSLVQRGVAALVIEPPADGPTISAKFIQRAEELGLPLFRLRATVPFVELAEKINRQIVSEHAATLQQADEVSQRLARHIASAGPNLTPLLEMIASALRVRATMEDLSGQVIAESGPEGQEDEQGAGAVATDLFVGADVAARLVLYSKVGTAPEQLELVAQRLGSIVSLAFAQHYRPGRLQIADTSLLRAIVSGAGTHFIVERARQAQVPENHPSCLMVFQSFDMSRVRSVLENTLHSRFPSIRTYLEAHRLYAMVQLDPHDPRRARTQLVQLLREALSGMSVECCVGPLASKIAHARWSLAEALTVESLASPFPNEGQVRDASDYALERVLKRFTDSQALNEFIDEQLGLLIAADKARGSSLLKTLEVWLGSGCNSTLAANRLYLERQTMHKRLTKIFSLIGGDPRETGRILTVHLACQLALRF